MKPQFRVLGQVEASVDGVKIDLGGPKQKAVLAVLLANANATVSIDILIEEIWGDSLAGDPRHTLRTYISGLRKLFEPDHVRGEEWRLIKTVDPGYELEVHPLAIDSVRAQSLRDEALKAPDREDAYDLLGQALSLFSGRPYGDLETTSVLATERTRLSQLHLSVQEAYFEAAIDLGRHESVIGELQTAASEHPFNEALAGLLMISLYRAGRQSDALDTYKTFSRAIGEELGLEPGPAIVELEEKILLQDPSISVGAGASHSNLPASSTSFVGREEDLEIAAELLPKTRVLTLTGPGGIGKTRLAIELAATLTDDYEDGVWLVELAPLSEPHLVPLAIARELDIDPRPDQTVTETIVERLRQSKMLVVFDNCEHLIEAAAELVSAIVKGCPDVTLIATSREPLNAPGETQLRVTGLVASDAVRMFTDRAARQDSRFKVGEHDQLALTEICERLDGMPLGIELAAVRVAVLTLAQINEGLDNRFSLLTGGRRTEASRLQTLEAAIDWSHDLLQPNEQQLFRRLSVFRGSFDLESVNELHAYFGGHDAILDLVGGLVAKSLVNTERAAETIRYELLETIRQYARGKASAANEWQELELWHRQYFGEVISQALPHLVTGKQLVWLDKLELEHDNLRAALERANEVRDLPAAAVLAADLSLFWFLHSHYSEAEEWYERLIPSLDAAKPAVRAKLLLGSGLLARSTMSDLGRSRLLEAITIAREIGSNGLEGWGHAYLGLIDMITKSFDQAAADARQALDLFQEAQSLSGVGFALWIQAAAEYLSDRFSERGADHEKAIAVASQLAGPAKAIGDRNFLGHLGYSAGFVMIDAGDLLGAADELSYSTRGLAELGNKACTAHNLDQIARLQSARGEHHDACVILGASKSIRDLLGFPGHPMEVAFWDEAMTDVREHLAPDAFSTAWDEGYAISFRGAVDYALSRTSG